MKNEKYQACIDACLTCATACEKCASACLTEKDVTMLSGCIKLDWACSAICVAAARMMSADGGYVQEVCELCADICNACAEECEKHTGMDHCQLCAEACRRCIQECQHLVDTLVTA